MISPWIFLSFRWFVLTRAVGLRFGAEERRGLGCEPCLVDAGGERSLRRAKTKNLADGGGDCFSFFLFRPDESSRILQERLLFYPLRETPPHVAAR